MKGRTKNKCLLVAAPWANFRGPSISIGTLAAYAKARGFSVDAYHMHLLVAAELGLLDYDDASLSSPHCIGEALCAALLSPDSEPAVRRYVEKHQPHLARKHSSLKRAFVKAYRKMDVGRYDMVGFTVNYQQLFSSLLLATWIKRDHPDVRIVLGGRCIAGKLSEPVMRCFDQIDWCIDGEGEQAFVRLLDLFDKGDGNFEEAVPGLIYRRNGEIKANARLQLTSLEELPDPDYDNYFNLLDTHPILLKTDITPHVAVEESRGCIYRCAFCTDRPYWQGCRTRPSVEVADSVLRLAKKYSVDSVYIVSSFLQPKSCEELFPIIASHGRDYRIFCETKPTLTKRHLEIMKKAGVCEVFVGIEALDSNILRKMNKGTRFIDNLKIMKFCEELGIKCNSILLIAFPTETQADVDRSVAATDYACAYYPMSGLFTFKLLDGSPVYLSPEKFGITHIDENAVFGRLLQKRMGRDWRFWYKNFKTKHAKRNYGALRRRHHVWKMRYMDAEVSGIPLLYFTDCGEFLKIDDFRESSCSVKLDGIAREIYLFCDTIRNLNEIEERFPDHSSTGIKKLIDDLYRMKLMYREKEACLSLAIQLKANRRHFFPFI